MKTYAFVDGAYLREKFQSCMKLYHGEEPVIDIVGGNALIRENAHKVFYYDCIDERERDKDKGEDFQARIRSQEEYFTTIRNLAGWHVREGRLVGARKAARQKRVDVLLAVEALSHAFNKNMERMLLYAGDDDFTPLVEELLRHGTYTEVRSDRWVASQHLLHASDHGRRLNYDFYHQLAPEPFRQQHPKPEQDLFYVQLSGGRVIKEGSSRTQERVMIYDLSGTFHFCHSVPGRGLVSAARSRDLSALEAFLIHDFHTPALVPENWSDPGQTVAV